MRVNQGQAQATQTSKIDLTQTSVFAEHAKVAATLKEMAKQTKADEAGYVIFLPEAAQGYKACAFEYCSGHAKQMNLDKPAGATIRGTVCINVSGHNGQADAKAWSKSNTYNVRVTLPNGKVIEKNHIARNQPASEEYSTKIPIEFPAMTGTTLIEAWADHSSADGYYEGRVYEVHSFDDPKKYDFARPAHASQRDDTADNPT